MERMKMERMKMMVKKSKNHWDFDFFLENQNRK
jgi:hypothetical protein